MFVCGKINFYTVPIDSRPGSSVGIETGYGLDGLGIESLWGRDFPHPSDRPWAHPASCTMGTGSFPGAKRPGRGIDHPPLFSAEITLQTLN